MENFPTIPTEGEKIQNSNLNATSLNISQDEVIKSFDNVEYAKIPTQKKTKMTFKTPCPIHEPENQNKSSLHHHSHQVFQ